MKPEDLKGKSLDQISSMFAGDSFSHIAKNLGMNDKETTEAREYIFVEHAECRKKIKRCAGYSYGYMLGESPTNIGPVFVVRCTICKQEKEVFDVSDW